MSMRIPGPGLRSPRTWLVIAGGLLLVLIVAASVYRSQSVPSVSVKTAVVAQRLLNDDALVTGQVESVQSEQIVAPFGARLLKFDVAEGDHFAAGQVLAEMDTTDVEKQAREADTALALAEAQQAQAYNPATPQDLAQAQANQAADQAAADAADQKLDRTRQLEAQGFASKSDLEAAESEQTQDHANLQTAIATLADLEHPDPHKLAVADAQVVQARVAAEDAHLTVAEGKLTAPFAGVVLEKIPEEGSYLQPGALVLVVASPAPVQVEADLSEQDIGGVALGQNADVQWAGQPGNTWQATVSRIAPAVIQSSQQNENVVRVYLGFAQNPDGLLPGASVDVTIHRIAAHQALVVPNEALLVRGGASILYVVSGKRARLRTVRAGYTNELYTEILSGVNAGDRVVLDPQALHDGEPVKDTGGGSS